MAEATSFSNLAGTAAGPYVRALLELLGDRAPVAVLEEMPAFLREVLAAATPEGLRRPERPGKWSVLEVIAHLADSETAFAWRIRLTLAQERPQLVGYDQDAWARSFAYREADPAEVMALFAALREGNLRLLRRATAADWDRIGVHEERGEESLLAMTQLYAAHDLVHRRQIVRIRETVGR